MKVVAGKTGLPQGYAFTLSGAERRWEADPVSGRVAILHLKTFHPLDDWYGLSPVEPAGYAIDQRNESDRWNMALLQNGARPSGALVYEPRDGAAANLTDEQFARLRQEVAAQYGGAKNAGRPMLLDGGLRWQEMSLSPKDMDFLDARHAASRDVAQAFGVPPQLLGIPGDNTYSNYQEARLSLWDAAAREDLGAAARRRVPDRERETRTGRLPAPRGRRPLPTAPVQAPGNRGAARR
jgi:phage portal protein BeeE